jgi:hypothetical protein
VYRRLPCFRGGIEESAGGDACAITGVLGAVADCAGEGGIRWLSLAELGRSLTVSDTDDFERGRVLLNRLTGVVMSTPTLSRERGISLLRTKAREEIPSDS